MTDSILRLSEPIRDGMLGWRCGLVLSLLFWTANAHAEPVLRDAPRPREVQLDYSVPPRAADCPDDEAFKARVRKSMTFDPFVPAAPARVIVTIVPAERRDQFRGRFELRDATGALLWERDYPPEHCLYVVAAVAMGLSIQLNRPVSELPAVAPPAPASSSSVAPAESPAKAAPAQTRPAVRPTVPSPVKTNSRSPKKGTRPLVGAYGRGSIVLWTAPVTLAGQVSVGVSLHWPDFYVGLEGQGQPPAGAAVDGSPVLTFSRVSAGPVACAVWRYLHGCGVAQVGAMYASAPVAPPRSDAAAGVWAGGRIVLQQSLHPRVALGVSTDVQAALRRPVVTLSHERIWEAPILSLSLGLSVVTFF